MPLGLSHELLVHTAVPRIYVLFLGQRPALAASTIKVNFTPRRLFQNWSCRVVICEQKSNINLISIEYKNIERETQRREFTIYCLLILRITKQWSGSFCFTKNTTVDLCCEVYSRDVGFSLLDFYDDLRDKGINLYDEVYNKRGAR